MINHVSVVVPLVLNKETVWIIFVYTHRMISDELKISSDPFTHGHVQSLECFIWSASCY